jgi:hypothetical protein
MIRISKNTVLERILVIVLSTLLLPIVLLYLIFGLWLDGENVIVKQRRKVDVYTISDFCTFHLEYYGMYLSHTFRYYRLNVNGKKYRVRYYTARLDSINDLLDSKNMLSNLEDGIKKEIALRS